MMRLAPFALLLAGCGMMGALTASKDEFMLAVREFNDGIRWGMAEKSAGHLPVEKRQKFAEQWSALEEELDVMDYEIQRVEWGENHDTADVRVDLTWTLKRRGIVERTVVMQHWVRDRGWLLASMKRLKGPALAILE